VQTIQGPDLFILAVSASPPADPAGASPYCLIPSTTSHFVGHGKERPMP